MKRGERCPDCSHYYSGIFAGISKRERSRKPCIMQMTLYQKRQPIFLEGEVSNLVFLVRSGLVKLFKSSLHERTQILNILGPGDILGFEALSRSQYAESATPITKAELCWCQRERFLDLLSKEPSVALRLVKVMNQDLSKIQNLVCDLGTKKALSRLASCLLLLVGKQGVMGETSTFQLPIMRCEMGEFLGLSTETISRRLKELCASRVIKLDHRRLTILNLQKLKAIAKG